MLSKQETIKITVRGSWLEKNRKFCGGGGIGDDEDSCGGKPCCKNMIEASETRFKLWRNLTKKAIFSVKKGEKLINIAYKSDTTIFYMHKNYLHMNAKF